MRLRPSTALAALLPALLSCSSPLDEATDRIDTQITNIIKFKSVAVSARLALPSDTVLLDDWSYDMKASALVVDSSVSPHRIRLDRTMVQYASETPRIWLKELRIRIDDAMADSATRLIGDPARGSGIAATVNVNGMDYTADNDYTASGTLHYIRGEKNRVEGTLLIGIDRSPAFTLMLAVNISASQD